MIDKLNFSFQGSEMFVYKYLTFWDLKNFYAFRFFGSPSMNLHLVCIAGFSLLGFLTLLSFAEDLASQAFHGEKK